MVSSESKDTDMETPDNNESSQRNIDYVKELVTEKLSLDSTNFSNAMRLLDEEIIKAQKGKSKEYKPMVDLYKDKPIKVTVKVLVPVKEHPRFNFVGKLLGPKGNSLKRLQEETMTRMAIMGRGSMRDKQKEEECRSTLDPKFSHLSEDLHVEITALAPPAEAHARLAYAMAEVRKYLVPDANDDIRMEQLRELETTGVIPGPAVRRHSAPPAQAPGGKPRSGAIPPRFPPHPNAMPPHIPQPMPPPPMAMRGLPNQTKVLSILDKARMALEEGYSSYDDSPAQHPPQHHPGYYDNGGAPAYYEEFSGGPSPPGLWKGYKSPPVGGVPPMGPVGVGQGNGGVGNPAATRYRMNRPSPYSRPHK